MTVTHLVAGVFDIVIGCAMLLLFVRLMFQFAGIDAKEDFAKPVYRFTRIVDVFGRIFPTLGGGRINTAAIMLLLILRLGFIWGILLLMRQDMQNIGLFHSTDINLKMIDYLARHFSSPLMFFVGAVTLILDFLRMAQYIIIGSFIGSWVVMFTQRMPVILGIVTKLSEPLIEPFRKIIPPMGMFDLAPMVGFFLIILLEMVVQTFGVYLLTLL